MAVDISTTKHAVCYPSKMLAAEGGAHVYSIQLTADLDNGSIVTRGTFVELDHYNEGSDACTSKFVILGQAPNGNYYVEVTTPGNGLLVRQDPRNPYASVLRAFNNEALFYNEAGDVVECYELHLGDVFEISAKGISGTITDGAELEVVSKKLSVVVKQGG